MKYMILCPETVLAFKAWSASAGGVAPDHFQTFQPVPAPGDTPLSQSACYRAKK